jgi:iron uptake system EfeUOB component EfeO/EfeM
MMPNKTIYVKDADLPLFEQAHELLGESVSSMFADFLKERIGKVSPEERMTELSKQISRKRSELRKERALPQFLDGVYAEAESFAKKALQALRAGDTRKAKVMYYAGNAYYERAEREQKDARELGEKIAELLA